MCNWLVLIGFCGHMKVESDACNHRSETLLRERSFWLGHEFGKPNKVVRRTTEYDQPVRRSQRTQLDVAQRTGLLEPSRALLDQPATAQTDRTARLSRGSAVQVAAAVLIVLRYTWRTYFNKFLDRKRCE